MNIAVVEPMVHGDVESMTSTGERIDQLIEQIKLSLHRNQTVQYHATLGLTEKMLKECNEHFKRL
jgi:hypothetical protein